MKTKILLSIQNPCSENWETFMPSGKGGFCASCSKDVTDFTKMNDEQILQYFSNRPGQTCGRFRPDQLKGYSQKTIPHLRPGLTLLRAGFLSLMVLFAGKPLFANAYAGKQKSEVIQFQGLQINGTCSVASDHIVKGQVKSEEDGEPLPGVNIYLKGTSVGTSTDASGHFEFPEKLKTGDVLVFSFIGLETREYVVPSEVKEIIEIQMALSSTVMLGEVAVHETYTVPSTGVHKLWQKVKGLF